MKDQKGPKKVKDNDDVKNGNEHYKCKHSNLEHFECKEGPFST